MSEILSIEGTDLENAIFSTEEKMKEEEQVEVEAPIIATPEDSLERMQSEEAIIKATMPNLQELEIVEEAPVAAEKEIVEEAPIATEKEIVEEAPVAIKEEVEEIAPHLQYMERLGELKKEVESAKHPTINFEKRMEQVSFLLGAYKDCGGDIKEFMGLLGLSKEKTFLDITFVKGTPNLRTNLFVGAGRMTGQSEQELAHAIERKEEIEEIVKERENGVLEKELADALFQFYKQALIFHSKAEKMEELSFQPLLFKLYDFEQANGFPFLGPKLLGCQLGWLFRTIDRCVDSHWKYDEGLQITLDCLGALKEEKQSMTLIYATEKACETFLAEDWTKSKEKDFFPLNKLLPYIAGHGGFYLIKKSFNEKFTSLDPWAKELKWIELHIDGARLLASENQEKGKEFLEKASKLIEERLWTYPFSWNKEVWDNSRQEAIESLKEVKSLYNEER